MADTGIGFGTSGARGLVSSMSDELCYAYTLSFLELLPKASLASVVIGHDLRPSSPRIASACAAAIRDFGLNVVYAGALPTPALAYYGALLGAPVVVVTGSHIPFDRNGIKFYRAEGEISKSDEAGIQAAVVDLPSPIEPFVLPEPDDRPRSSYLSRYADFFLGSPLEDARVAIYEHSGVGREILREILESLGAEVLCLGRTDTFVPIDTEAVRREDAERAILWANEYGFDAILSTDGDADRPLIGDEKGHWLRGDAVGVLTARYLRADWVVTPVSSNSAVEKCGWFNSVARTRIGSPYVIEGMEVLEAAHPGTMIVGYEANGGFLLGSDFAEGGKVLRSLPTRDAVLPMLSVLIMAQEKGVPLSMLAEELPLRYTASDRLQSVPSLSSASLLERLKGDASLAARLLAPHSGALLSLDGTDGLRFTFESGDIVHLRPSGNAPELRCYTEASLEDKASALCEAAMNEIRPYLEA